MGADNPSCMFRRKVRLLVAAGTWPHFRGNLEAANVVCHSIIKGLLENPGLEVAFIYLNARPTPLPSEGQLDLEELSKQGLRLVDPLCIGSTPRMRDNLLRTLRSVLRGKWEELLPGYGLHPLVEDKLGDWRPDAVLTIWSEFATAVVAGMNAHRFAYYGNLDTSLVKAHLEISRLAKSAASPWDEVIFKLKEVILPQLAKQRLKSSFRNFSHVWNVAENDARILAQWGIRSSYLSNTWHGEVRQDWSMLRDRTEQLQPVRIVGSVGRVSATANTFGLLTLARDVMPELRKAFGQEAFEVHLFGGGQPAEFLKPFLQDANIRIRGFVDDLEQEILDSPVFLVTNNHTSFRVGHTRILHAWSLGACVVTFEGCRDAMPELRHGENALLGRTPAQVAELVVQAARDRTLRRRIGAGGVQTLKSEFTSTAVAQTLGNTIEQLAGTPAR